MIAFTDSNGGYYQVDAPEGFVPDWAKYMTPCAVMPAPTPTPSQLALAAIRAREEAIRDDQAKLTRTVSLKVALDTAYEMRPVPSMTRQQVHDALMLQNGGFTGYARLYNEDQAISQLRTQL